MLYGYAGKVLHVDLTSGSLTVEEPSEAFYRTYLGGSALGVYYLLQNTPPGADPLGPENTLTFAVSAMTGAPISGQVALQRRGPVAADRRGGLFGGGRVLPGGAEVRRVRRHRGAGGVAAPGVPVGEGRGLRVAGRLAPVGQAHHRGRPDAAGGVGRRSDPGGAGGPGRGEAGALRLHHEHGEPGQRPWGHGCGDGVQAAQGGGGAGDEEGPAHGGPGGGAADHEGLPAQDHGRPRRGGSGRPRHSPGSWSTRTAWVGCRRATGRAARWAGSGPSPSRGRPCSTTTCGEPPPARR